MGRLILLGFLWLLPLPFAPAVSVYLKKAAVLSGETYTLGELAEVSWTDGEEAQRLEGLILGRSPERMTLLPVAAFKERLSALAGEQLILVGSRVALLPAAAVPEGQLWFYRQLLEFLEDQEERKIGRIEVETLSKPEGLAKKEEGGADFSLVPLSGRRNLLAGQVRVFFQEGSLDLWIHHFLPLARARQALKAGQILRPEDIEYVEEDVSLLPGSFLTPEEKLDQHRMAAPIPAGTRIEPSLLQRQLSIRAGDPVTIVFLRSGLRVSLPGRALGSGSAGDAIEVRALEGSRKFRGRVCAPGEVVVESP